MALVKGLEGIMFFNFWALLKQIQEEQLFVDTYFLVVFLVFVHGGCRIFNDFYFQERFFVFFNRPFLEGFIWI